MNPRKHLPTPKFVEVDNLLAAIEYAAKKLFFSVDRKNMNRRSLTESLDDKIMGEVATIAVVEFLRSIGVQSASYDQFRLDGFKRPDPGWDILLGFGTYQWVAAEDRSEGRPLTVQTASVKSSRLPKGDTVQTAIEKRDFKIFAKSGQSLAQALTADIEMQVYFQREKTWLPKGGQITATEVTACIESRENCMTVLDRLKIAERFGTCALTAWSDKEQILDVTDKLKQKWWTSYHVGSAKKMWCAPLRQGRSFDQLKERMMIK